MSTIKMKHIAWFFNLMPLIQLSNLPNESALNWFLEHRITVRHKVLMADVCCFQFILVLCS